MILTIQAVLWLALLAAPSSGQAQTGEETSVWQYGVRDADWETIERLQEEVRDYQGEGAIGAYELEIRTDGERYDVLVTAEIVDAIKLAELRGLETAESTPNEAASRDTPGPPPS